MNPDYNLYVERFRDYISSTGKQDEFVQEHLDLKSQHTFRVVDNIRRIATDSGLQDEETLLAKIIALVHDIGRFKQFIRFRTFDDSQSLNHAELGVQILKETAFLKELPPDTQRIIYAAIMNHNVSKLDPGLDRQVLHYARLIRDADKVDIWYILTLRDVVNVILAKNEAEESYAVPQYILDSFRNGTIVPYASSMNDYRLLRLSWIYDMNFTATYALIRKRGYLGKILAKIPHSPAKSEIAEIIYRYMDLKAEIQQHASRLLK